MRLWCIPRGFLMSHPRVPISQAQQPRLCHPSATCIITPVTLGSPSPSLPLCTHPHCPACWVMDMGTGTDHLHSTRHHQGAGGQGKGPGEVLAAGTIAITKQMSLQTSQTPRDGAGQQQKAHKTQDQVKAGLCKAGGLSTEEASRSSSPAVTAARDNLCCPPALFSDTTKSFCSNTVTHAQNLRSPHPV